MRVALLAMFASVLAAQQLQLGTAKAVAPVALRARPDAGSPVIFELPAGAALKTIGGMAKNGFVRVIGDTGPSGWAADTTVAMATAPAPVPCPAVEPASRKAAKPGSPEIIDFNDVIRLQQAAERQHFESVGRAVRIGGYVAGKPEGPREAGSCDGGQAGDWLFHIVQDASSKEFQGLIARVPATKRNTAWSLDRLRAAQQKGLPVLVTGTLFYDRDSFVNDDSANPITGQLRRAWLWEVRQVTSILVCTGGDCEPGSSKGWLALENLK